MLLRLFTSFLLIGVGAYGGGTATISLIYHELVTKRQWLTDGQMTRLITLAELTPGPIAVNSATFVGYEVGGVLGSLLATIAVVLPSMLMLIAFTLFYNRYLRRLIPSETRQRMLAALRPGILALILYSVWRFGRSAITSVWELPIAAACLAVLLFLKKINPLFLILAGGVVGLIVYFASAVL